MILWILGTLLALIVITLLLRIRVGCDLGPEKKLVFARIGRTGSEFDFTTKTMIIRLFGMRIKEVVISGAKKTGSAETVAEPASDSGVPQSQPTTKPKVTKVRPLSLLLEIISESSKALWHFVVGILKGIIVEEAQGELSVGFDSPDVTGKAFGYYHAVAWAAPSLANRISITPVFTEKVMTGKARVTLALPVYVLVYRTGRLIANMPIRKIIRYSRGIQKGANHGK
ncbi:MAG: hypothetical protein WAU88_05450 [Candidatus Zixiibacteriota bacterium]